MVLFLFAIALISILTDLFLMSSVIGFFQKKISLTDIIRVSIPFVLLTPLVWIGILAGKKVFVLFPNHNIWYSATILFMLSIKLMYDGIKLSSVKKTVNPLNNAGLIYLITQIAVKVFFISMSFGLLRLEKNNIIFLVAISLLFSSLAGYFRGFTLKKLINLKSDIIFAAVYFLMAIYIIIKIQL